jgi:CubicO group peptidase (beta-lactamase class C family)
LLEHTSGQPRRFTRIAEAEAAFTLREGVWRDVTDEERQRRIELLLRDLCDVDLLFPPGSRVAYTSIGFFLLGVVIERVGRMRLDRYLDSAILRPAGIIAVGYLPLGHAVGPERIAPTEYCSWRRCMPQGHVHDEIVSYVGGVSGLAGLFGTAAGVTDFGLAVLNEASFPLSPAVLRASEQSQTTGIEGENRGLGWLCWTPNGFMGDYVSRRSFGHTGFTGTSLLIDPENELVVTFLTNRVHPSRRNNIMHFRRDLHDRIAVTFVPA